MKSFIICIFMLFPVSVLSAQPEATQPTVDPTTQAVLERVDTAGEWVSTTLAMLADKMGTTVEYLWPTFVKKIFITGVSQVFGGIMALIASIVLCVYLRKIGIKIKAQAQDESDHDSAGFCTFFSIVFLITGFVAMIIFVKFGVINMVAPEPEALNNIVAAIRQLR